MEALSVEGKKLKKLEYKVICCFPRVGYKVF